MKKTMFLLLFIAFLFGQTKANNDPINIFFNTIISPNNDTKTIAILPFDGDNSFKARENLYNTISEAVVKSGRFKILEREKLKNILTEIDRNKHDYTRVSEELVEQGKIEGAQYFMFGHINTANIVKTSDKDSKGKTTYRHECSISVSLRIVNIETGEIQISETIQIGEGTYSSASDDTRDGAWIKGCEKILSKTEEFLKAAFPQEVEIVKIISEKKGVAFEILIAAGSEQGIEKKDEVKIFDIEEIEIGGEIKEREIHIATMVVQKVENSDFSICKVTSGGGKLKQRINDDAPIKCKSMAKRAILKL
jgi:hypothetical protein